MGTIAWIATAPVKGLRLEHVDEVDLTEAGPAGDRRFFLVDENERLVNAKGLGVLQQVRASYDESTRTLTVRMPDGRELAVVFELDGELGANFWGVTKPARRVLGPWSDALSDLAGRHLELVMPDGPAPDRLRSGAATLLSTSSAWSRSTAAASACTSASTASRRTPRTAGSAAAYGSGRQS